jgi:hypothetical protein
MRAKDVIVGRTHRLAKGTVLIERVEIRGEHTGNPSFTFYGTSQGGQPRSCYARQMGPGDDIDIVDWRAEAEALNQEHRQIVTRLNAPEKARRAARAAAAGYPPHKSIWARHRSDSFSCLTGNMATHIEFGHMLELDFARHLDKLDIQWSHEPHRLPIGGSKSWRPDFYLPSLDLYVELTQDDGEVKLDKREGAAIHQAGLRIIALGRSSIEHALTLAREPLVEHLGAWLAQEQEWAAAHRAACALATQTAAGAA